MEELRVRQPDRADRDAFLAAVHRSRGLHATWVAPLSDAAAFARYVRRYERPDQAGFVGWLGDAPAGAVHLNNIVRGALLGASVGFYAFEPFARRGIMRRLLAIVLDEAFGPLGLHRVEANIQPANRPSRALVTALGFRQRASRRGT